MSIRRVQNSLTLLYVDDKDTLYSITGFENSLHVMICKRNGKDIHRVFGNIDELRSWNPELAEALIEDTHVGCGCES
jgi:hypothetical protein